MKSARDIKSPDDGESSGGVLATTDSKRGRDRTSDKAGKAMDSLRQADEAPGRLMAPARRSFFELYKPGHGYYTRMCTGIGGGAIILGAGNFLFTNLEVFRDPNKPWTLWLQVSISLSVVVGLGLLLYWLAGVKHGTCDFLIATEGEMKKVSWSTRRELIGSTKVVIAFTFFLAVLLASVDTVFIHFFQFIGVLWSGT